MTWIIDHQAPVSEMAREPFDDRIHMSRLVKYFQRTTAKDAILSHLSIKLAHETELRSALWTQLTMYTGLATVMMGAAAAFLYDFVQMHSSTSRTIGLVSSAVSLGLSLGQVVYLTWALRPAWHAILFTGNELCEWWHKQIDAIKTTGGDFSRLNEDEYAMLALNLDNAGNLIDSDNRLRAKRLRRVQVVTLFALTAIGFTFAISTASAASRKESTMSEHKQANNTQQQIGTTPAPTPAPSPDPSTRPVNELAPMPTRVEQRTGSTDFRHKKME